MEWNYNETENQYELYQDGQKSVIFPDKIASEVEAIFSGLGRVAITQVTEDESQDSLSKTKDDAEPIVGLSRTDMPDIPSGSNLKTNADRDYYNRLVNNPTSQPARYRRAIRENGRISRPRFDAMAEKMGYEPGAGAHNASLLVLDRIGEIDKDGRGDNQTIRWDGE
jgi:hypothetical protein